MSDPADNALHAEGFMARMWAGWRLPYISGDHDTRVKNLPEGMSTFEGIFRSGLPDDATYILWRGATCFALMNAFPYTTGHLMVLPQRAVADLGGLPEDQDTALWRGGRGGASGP